MHSDLYAILSGISELTALVGDRIHPITAALNTPSVSHCTYSVSGAESLQNLDGPSTDQQYTIEINIYHPNVTELAVAADQVKLQLNGYRDIASGGVIQLIGFAGESESTDQDETTVRTQNYNMWTTSVAMMFMGMATTNRLSIVRVSSDYTIKPNEHLIFVDATNGDIVLTFPEASSPNQITIRRIDQAVEHSVSFATQGMDTLDICGFSWSATFATDGISGVWRGIMASTFGPVTSCP